MKKSLTIPLMIIIRTSPTTRENPVVRGRARQLDLMRRSSHFQVAPIPAEVTGKSLRQFCAMDGARSQSDLEHHGTGSERT
jgi:hypothetical protein